MKQSKTLIFFNYNLHQTDILYWCGCLLTWRVLSNRLRRKPRNSLHELWYSFRARSDHLWDYLFIYIPCENILTNKKIFWQISIKWPCCFGLKKWEPQISPSRMIELLSRLLIRIERTIRNSPLIVGWMNLRYHPISD